MQSKVEIDSQINERKADERKSPEHSAQSSSYNIIKRFRIFPF